jgi:hypothetical protein
LDGGGKTLVVTCEKAEEGQMWPRIQLSAWRGVQRLVLLLDCITLIVK